MSSRISINPAVCHGKPVISGTRVMVSTLLGALAGGDSMEAILEDYPAISREDIAAALEFASELSDYQVSAYEAVALSSGWTRIFRSPPWKFSSGWGTAADLLPGAFRGLRDPNRARLEH